MNSLYFLKQIFFCYWKKILTIFLRILAYSYFKPLTGSNLEAFIAGNIETTIVTIMEQNAIIKIEFKFISDGIVFKK